MLKLTDIVKGSRIKGVVGDGAVTVTGTTWHGDGILRIEYMTNQGKTDTALLYDFATDGYEIEDARPWSFDADPDMVKLVSEAYRIRLAHLFDPYLAVRTSQIEPLPHQISAVYEKMLPKLPLRYVLADDPGAGKTIMTGLLIKEMMTRGDLKRCLIVAPGNLVEQWQDELHGKFGLDFRILTNEMLESSATGNAFNDNDLCIGRLDKLSRDDDVRRKLEASSWDLVVCDEAHKMSATNFGGETKLTKRYRLGMLLGERTENLLLLTATPHNGKPADFRYFMALVDRDRFAGASRMRNQVLGGRERVAAQSTFSQLADTGHGGMDVSDCMRRLVKEELLRFDGRPLFPERRAYTVEYSLSPQERDLYDAVTRYVTEEFNRADSLDGKRRNSVGFALTILQRRLASSPEAIYQSLRRRRERLENRLDVMRNLARERFVFGYGHDEGMLSDDFDEDDYGQGELEDLEDDILDEASASVGEDELETEIGTLRELEAKANAVRMSGQDRKWDELSRLLQDNRNMFDKDGRREKLIIFTEHKDTLNYLASRIRMLLGTDESVITIQGGMGREERHRAEERFRQDADVRVMVATDAAGEGINLQRAHLMINYDLPWNPNRLEQRFGRIHRIGQTEVCHLWNLVAAETREGEVFQRLFSKLENEREALGGRVFDILGRLTFDDGSLSDLLMQAIRYGDNPEVKARLDTAVDNSVAAEALRKLLDERALTTDVMDINGVMRIREDMERMEAHKLEPHFIEAFFMTAMKTFGGRVSRREQGRFEVLEVPSVIRYAAVGSGRVLGSYERICFDKKNMTGRGRAPAELICPGHPLLDALVVMLIDRKGSLLKEGAVFVDDMDTGDKPRLLLYVEDSIQDGVERDDGSRRVVSKEFRFIELDAERNMRNAGYAPYLDYRAPRPSEREQVQKIVAEQKWLGADIEAEARSFAANNIVPDHFRKVLTQRLEQINKIEKAVRARLGDEIEYWDSKAWELNDAEKAGKTSNRLNSAKAQKRADELSARLEARLAHLKKEKSISPAEPRIIGGALVIPVGMLRSDAMDDSPFHLGDRRSIELAGMRAVTSIERSLGYEPEDVSAENVGYDIESRVPARLRDGEGNVLRMIEVKGRVEGVDTVIVSHNEVLCALNNPDGFILAIVMVDGNTTRTTYIRRPFVNPPDYSVTSTVYDIAKLKRTGEVILEKEETWQ